MTARQLSNLAARLETWWTLVHWVNDQVHLLRLSPYFLSRFCRHTCLIHTGRWQHDVIHVMMSGIMSWTWCHAVMEAGDSGHVPRLHWWHRLVEPSWCEPGACTPVQPAPYTLPSIPYKCLKILRRPLQCYISFRRDRSWSSIGLNIVIYHHKTLHKVNNMIKFQTYILLITVSCTIGLPSLHHDEEYEYSDSSFEDKRESTKYGNSLARAITYNKPMVPLEFWDKVKKKPRGRQMKESKLKEKMGTDFDPAWMSVERPMTNQRYVVSSLPESQVAQLMEEVTSLDIENDIRQLLENEADIKHEPTVRKAVGAFQQWLVKKSSCPVQFNWEDLGEYFWPRYVRKGECQASSGVGDVDSCSWPRGMSCNPADAEVLHLLRWHCRRRRTPDLLGLTTRQKIRKSYKCRWIKVPYPVTSSCKCD